MKTFTGFMYIAILCLNLFSQVSLQWERHDSYGAMNSGHGAKVLIDKQNFPVLVSSHLGWEYTFSYKVFKLSPQNGNFIWTHTILFNSFSSVFSDTLNNIYLSSSYINPLTATRGAVLTKRSSAGDIIFTVTDTSQPYSDLCGSWVDRTGNSYLLTGQNNRFKIMKYGSAGNLQWTTFHGGNDSINAPQNVITDNNGDVIMCGRVLRSGINYLAYVRLTAQGVVTDTMEFQLPTITAIYLRQLHIGNDNKIYLMGTYSSFGKNYYIFMKLNPDLSTAFMTVDSASSVPIVKFIVQNDNSVIRRYAGGILKYDAAGSVLWTNNNGVISDMISADDGYIYAAGMQGNDYYTCKIGQNGTQIWGITYNHPQMNNTAYSISTDADKNVYITGTSMQYNPGIQYFVSAQKYSQLTGVNLLSTNIPLKTELNQNYPNPFNPATNIKFSIKERTDAVLAIYDIQGKEVFRYAYQALGPGSYEYSWDASAFSSGIYFAKLTTDAYSETKRMILIK